MSDCCCTVPSHAVKSTVRCLEVFLAGKAVLLYDTEVGLLCLHAASDSCGTALGEMTASLLKPLTASCVCTASGLVHSLCVMCLLW